MKTTTKSSFNFGISGFRSGLICAAAVLAVIFTGNEADAQITQMNDFQNHYSAPIGTFQGINFREAGFSGLYPVAGTNGKEFWTVSDRGVNIDAANANPSTCRPTYDKIYSFPNYAPKIHRIRLNGDSLQILQTITIKRPNGTTATGIINPTGFGSTALEVASTDTVLDCANFYNKVAEKDTFGIDSEGIIVDNDGNFWLCEEGGPTVWKVNPFGVVIKRYTPYANLAGAQTIDVQIDTVFKYRKNNRGFEGIALAPNGKIYAIIQSPVLYPSKSVGENTRIHRILEIDPATDATRMLVYLNDGIIGASGSNQIRLRDWKIGDMAAINDSTFLVLEAALRGTTDIKRMYVINIANATPVNSGLYGGVTLEALVDAAGLASKGIVPVTKTLVMDLLANGWPAALDKAEGLAIINDSTLAIGNDNDYGQFSLLENGIATATTNLSHVITYRLQGANKLMNFEETTPALSQGITGPGTSQSPFLMASAPGVEFTSMLTVNETVGGYRMAGLPDGMGAFDNYDGTFTLVINHEINSSSGVVRAHGSKGAFVSKWNINKSDLSINAGSDLIQQVKIWNGSTYDTYSASNPGTLAAISRLCSGDMPDVSAFYNSLSGMGTPSRIFMSGEESGSEGRAFAHIVSGPEAGTSYQLPYLGRYSWENALACPVEGDKTIVVGTDDATPGQVYVYVGDKTSIGNEIEKAGLVYGKLYGIAVNGLAVESNTAYPATATAFTLVELAGAQNLTGLQLNSASNAAGVTNFLRPEDGHWDQSNTNDFYFVTTNNFTSPSRLYKVHFTNINQPELGGTIVAVLDGSEGPKMMDNMTIDKHGLALIQEDIGGQNALGKIWQYDTDNDQIKQIGVHDPYRFTPGAPGFLTLDEESSGIINMENILGPGKFLCNVQAHYPIPGEVVEGGQLLALYNPDSNVPCTISLSATVTACNSYNWNGNVYTASGNYTYRTTTAGGCDSVMTLHLTIQPFSVSEISGPVNGCVNTGASTPDAVYTIAAPASVASISWSIPAFANITGGQGTTSLTVHFDNQFVAGTISATVVSTCGATAIKNISIINAIPAVPASINGPTSVCDFRGTGTGVIYSTVPVSGAGYYNWSVPSGATLVSGQGSTSITVSFASGFTAGQLKVRAMAGCGNSAYKAISINAAIPAKPHAISGPATVCIGASATFNISPVANATSYLWTVPAGSIVTSGQGSTSLTVAFGTTGGKVSVRAVNACGTSGNTQKTVSVTGCARIADAISSIMNISPNPAQDLVTIRFESLANEPISLRIYDVTGKVYYNSQLVATEGENTLEADLSMLPGGIYAVEIASETMHQVRKLILQ